MAKRVSRSDLKLAQQAIRNRWPIDDALKAKVVKQVTKVLEGKSGPRDQMAAARVFVAMENTNAKQETDEKKDDRTSERTKLLAAVALLHEQRRLGIAPQPIPVIPLGRGIGSAAQGAEASPGASDSAPTGEGPPPPAGT